MSVSFAHRETEVLAHSSLPKSWSSARLDGERLSIVSTDSRLDSGLDLDLASLTPGYMNRSIGDLSWFWIFVLSEDRALSQSQVYFRLNRFSSRMVLHLPPFIFPSMLITIFPLPAEEKQAQAMMLPLRCHTAGMVCSGWWALLLLRQTYRFPIQIPLKPVIGLTPPPPVKPYGLFSCGGTLPSAQEEDSKCPGWGYHGVWDWQGSFSTWSTLPAPPPSPLVRAGWCHQAGNGDSLLKLPPPRDDSG